MRRVWDAMLDVDHEIASRAGLHCAPIVHKQLGAFQTIGGKRIKLALNW